MGPWLADALHCSHSNRGKFCSPKTSALNREPINSPESTRTHPAHTSVFLLMLHASFHWSILLKVFHVITQDHGRYHRVWWGWSSKDEVYYKRHSLFDKQEILLLQELVSIGLAFRYGRCLYLKTVVPRLLTPRGGDKN